MGLDDTNGKSTPGENEVTRLEGKSQLEQLQSREESKLVERCVLHPQ